MKFTVSDTKDTGFAAALNRCENVALRFNPKRANFNVSLSRVRIEATSRNTVQISASDGYTSINNYLNIDVDEPGVAVVDARKLARFVYSKPGKLKIRTTPKTMFVQTPNESEVKLNLDLTDGFPKTTPPPASGPKIKTDGKNLKDIFGISSMAEQGFSHLSGIFIEYKDDWITTIAANSFGGGIVSRPLELNVDPIKFLMPSKATRIVNRWISSDEDVVMYLSANGNTMYFFTDRFSMSSQSIEGIDKFPDSAFKALLDQPEDSVVEFNADKFVEAIQACVDMVFNDGVMDSKDIDAEERRIYLSVSGNEATIKTSEKSQSGSAKYNLGIESSVGPPFSFILDAKYSKPIIQSLTRLADANLKMEVGDATRKIIVSTANVYILFRSPYAGETYIMAGVAA